MQEQKQRKRRPQCKKHGKPVKKPPRKNEKKQNTTKKTVFPRKRACF
jgi:hypothetical protein